MKNVLVFLILCSSIAFAQTAKPVELKFSDYSVSVPLTVQNPGAAKSSLPLIAGGNTKTGLGVVFSLNNQPASGVIAVDILQSGSDTPVRTVTVAEFFGQESADWKQFAGLTKTSKTGQTVAYEFAVSGEKLRFIKTVESRKDVSLPSGKSIVVSLGLQGDKASRYKLRIHASVMGTLTAQKSVYTISTGDTGQLAAAHILFQLGSGATLNQTKDSKDITITSAEVSLGKKAPATAASLTISGTSVGYADHASKQAQNIADLWSGKKGTPSMISVTKVSKIQANPGDTLTYTIVNHNIGTAAAADISIDNPVPAGATYLEGSAVGKGTTVTVARTGRMPRKITWKYSAPFLPGDERFVTFKVIAK